MLACYKTNFIHYPIHKLSYSGNLLSTMSVPLFAFLCCLHGIAGVALGAHSSGINYNYQWSWSGICAHGNTGETVYSQLLLIQQLAS